MTPPRKYLLCRHVVPLLRDRVHDLGAVIVEEKAIASPMGSLATMLTIEGMAEDIRHFKSDAQEFVRRLDLFFVPEPPDVIVDTALCDHIAREYGSMIDRQVNLQNIRKLLSICLGSLPNYGKGAAILDFGCGIGLALEVVAQMGLDQDLKVIGTDASDKMTEQARQAGMEVLSLEKWLSHPPQSFDGIIASFVLHFGITQTEMRTIANQLRPSGCFVGNYHRASAEQLAQVFQQFQAVGMSGTVVNDSDNPILLLRAPVYQDAT
jgi:SAM-dependent methyltransferase